jgi:predicted SnoaL-like aldol condensation-catalyzing enzyme
MMKGATNMNKKEIATSFLTLASSGNVAEAYEKYVHPQFRHHNVYFKGGRESLQKAMEENAR